MPTLSKEKLIKALKKQKSSKNTLKKNCHKLWREIVFKKAKGKCEYPNCYQEATQPHHLKTKGAYPHLRFDTRNGMALCYYHHKGGKGAHSDINFKEVIIRNKVRSEEFFNQLEMMADKRYKLNLELEYIYLKKELKKYE